MNKTDLIEQLMTCSRSFKHEITKKSHDLLMGDPIYVGDIFEEICQISRAYVSQLHELKMRYDWESIPSPEWMNHFQDLYYQMPSLQNTFWLERGIFGRQTFSEGRNDQVLELCCGDGFNTKHFYSPYVGNITAVDFDESAIQHAKKFNTSENISYQTLDIRKEFPCNKYNAIIWDAAIEHFTTEEMDVIFDNIKKCLLPNACLSGYTLVERADGEKSLDQHEYEFKTKDELKELLKKYFKNVRVFETLAPERHNLYFYAGEGPLPFDTNWKNQT